jgi:hypothetical protein
MTIKGRRRGGKEGRIESKRRVVTIIQNAEGRGGILILM